MAKMGPKDRTNSSGHDRSTRQSRVSLAAKARELLNDGELMLDFYIKICEGKTPKVVRSKDGAPSEIGEEEYGPSPTLDQRILAMARITERAYGQAAQHMHIEAEVRAEVAAITGGVDTRYLQKLSPNALLAIRDAIKSLPAAPAHDDDNVMDVIEAESVEVGDDA